MMCKFKAFFQKQIEKIKIILRKKITKSSAWILLCICFIVQLFEGLLTGDKFGEVVVAAVCALIAFMSERVSQNK